MPVNPAHPDTYIEEIHTPKMIQGISTSTTAFIGRARKGPVNKPTPVYNFAEFQNLFGGLWKQSTMSYAVHQYFLNGGSVALIVRVINGGVKARFENRKEKRITFKAANEGQWANALRITIDSTRGRKSLFNIRVKEKTGNSGDPKKDYVELESFLNVSFTKNHKRNARKVLLKGSSLVRVRHLSLKTGPRRKLDFDVAVGGDDGNDLQDADLRGNEDKKTGVYALDKADTFGILCIPSPNLSGQAARSWLYTSVYANAVEYCKKRRAMLIVDPPSDWTAPVDLTTGIDNLGLARSENAAIYFPRIKAPDPLDSQVGLFSPCGAVAGIIARTDLQRGVWKAPAGTDAVLLGASDLQIHLTDQDIAILNQQGINCLRILPAGMVVWGARTMMGAENLASEWKYLPVRRLALYIEESLDRGTKWAVFEPNDERLWSNLRLNIDAFMQDLFRKGAFQGRVPKEAYFVKCDSETTTQADIDKGIVNITVGFAPLKPAEFIIIKIQQLAGLQD